MADDQAKKPGDAEPDGPQTRRRVRARQPTIIGLPAADVKADAIAAPSVPGAKATPITAPSIPEGKGAQEAKPAAPKPAAAAPTPKKPDPAPAALKPSAPAKRTPGPLPSSTLGKATPAARTAPASGTEARVAPAATPASRTAPASGAALGKATPAARTAPASGTESRVAPAAKAGPSAARPLSAPRPAEKPATPKALATPAPEVERGSDPPELEGPPTQVGGAAPAPVDELEGPPTHVGPTAGAGFSGPAVSPSGFAGPSVPEAAPEPEPDIELPSETDPALDVPVEDLPFEPTMPAVKASPPEPPHDPERPSTEPRDLIVEPTVVVHPSIAQAQSTQQPTYRVDVDSGLVQLETDADLELAGVKPRSAGLFIALGVLVGLLVLGGGGAALYLFVLAPSDDASDPIAEPSVASEATTTAEEPAPEIAPAPSEPPVAAPAEPTEASAEEAEESAEEGAEESAEEAEGEEGEQAPAVGRVIPRAELEGFDLERPRLSRRARRMNAAARRRAAVRLRTAALRAYREGDYARSEATFREALEHVPGDGAAIEGLARATAQQSRFAEAIAWGNLAVEQSPRSGGAYRVLGDVWRQAGHPDEAARIYRRGLFRAPNDRWLRQRLRDVRSGD